jgi:hypothetical protein
MVETLDLKIKGSTVDSGQTHQNSEGWCSLYFNGTQVVLHRTEGIFLNVDDCIAMRDFFNVSIKEMQKKEIE